ncbi:FAD-dependent oxidoreductase [Kineococcus sp. SYSU DK001]|uniref:FAD-dependent oxidoreductase n=1 Tax=Kineococcus sp. SYSU DK001 TaxID=3383122 RepID=UPI003D7D917F
MNILIVGAGLAGSAAALHLSRAGHAVTVVDSITEPYRGGYMLQLDQRAERCMSDLGLGDVMEKLSIPAPDIAMVHRGPRGHRTVTTVDPRGYSLVRRGDFIRAISERAAAEAPLHLGRELVGVEQRLDHVVAHFRDGDAQRYDLLVGADGLRSTVRRLVLGPDEEFVHENGWTNVWVDVPIDVLGRDRSEIHFGKGSGAYFFPYPEGDRALYLAFTPTGGRLSTVPEMIARARREVEVGGGGARVSAALAAADPAAVRLTRFAQVRMPRWHAGRVVLLGDSAYCVDPISGVGTTASLLGAERLAAALGRHGGDVDAAARAYTAEMAPRVRLWQRTTAGFMEAGSGGRAAERLHGVSELARAARELVRLGRR